MFDLKNYIETSSMNGIRKLIVSKHLIYFNVESYCYKSYIEDVKINKTSIILILNRCFCEERYEVNLDNYNITFSDDYNWSRRIHQISFADLRLMDLDNR